MVQFEDGCYLWYTSMSSRHTWVRNDRAAADKSESKEPSEEENIAQQTEDTEDNKEPGVRHTVTAEEVATDKRAAVVDGATAWEDRKE